MRSPGAVVAGVVTFTAFMLGCVGCPAEEPAGPVGRFLDNDATPVVTLEQGWTDEQARWFYDTPQGSRLVPYSWFLHLEEAGQAQPFLRKETIRTFGYLPRTPSPINPDGLPIGFVRDEAPDRAWLGMTCAACHTAQIDHGGKSYLIDGGPTMADIEGFLRALEAALEATLQDAEKFSRFSNGVLGRDAAKEQRDLLKVELAHMLEIRRGYNRRNMSEEASHAFGPGRYDAFGAILNEVSVNLLGVQENRTLSTAPVSYPFLWDTPQHDLVQWNGVASNGRLGSLARNVGEVLGVFGDVVIPDTEPFPLYPGYRSTVELDNLGDLEKRLESLRSPKWPADFPPLDPELVARGRKLFEASCLTCHADIDRADPRRKVKAMMSDVGTDESMSRNFADRRVKTGRLKGFSQQPFLARLPGADEFGETASGEDVLVHVVVGTILGGYKDAPVDQLSDLRRKRMVEIKELLFVPPKYEYKARPLNGIWATAPYLHNGSVPTLDDLLKPAAERPVKFRTGGRAFDPDKVGLLPPATGGFELDTTIPGNSNKGHEHGPKDPADRRALLEYLKSL